MTGLGTSYDNGKIAYAFVMPNQGEDGYIIKSTDGAKTWERLTGKLTGPNTWENLRLVKMARFMPR